MSKPKISRKPVSNSVVKRQFWDVHINKCLEGNVNRKAYCREHSLDYEQFQYWYRKRNSEKPAQKISPLIPVQEKALAESADKILCTVELPSKVRLLIHDAAVVKDILKGAI